MKVKVARIKEDVLKLSEDIPAKEWEMDSQDIKFVDDIHLDCGFQKVGGEIIVEVNVTTHRQITCSRCLEQARQTVKQDFKRIYSIEKLKDYLDIDSDVREEILLNFPMKALCSEDCKGVCPGCGVNLNKDKCKC